MLVRDVLKAKGRAPITIAPDSTVKDALALFVEHNIGSLPVLDATGKLIGIFSERDVLYVVNSHCEEFPRRVISEVMTPNPITCRPDESVHEVMGQISRHRVGQLPVVDGDRLVGVVSVGDLVKAMFEQTENENRHLMAYLHGPV